MSPNITIVTAFFDIGRGSWTPDKGLPHYLQRSTETYMERFSHMAQLENEIIVYTTPNFKQQILDYRQDRPTKIVETSLDEYSELRNKISAVQQSETFQKLIHPSQIKNPEYWNADYVLVNFLKSQFACNAIETRMVNTELLAWLDFGYCRTADKVPPSKRWTYDFDPDRIHLFNYKEFNQYDSLYRIIATNDVHILGAKIVGGHKAWCTFSDLMNHSLYELLKVNMVDDDQTLLLMVSIMHPNMIELHRIPDHQQGLDPFVIFKDFNSDYE